MNWRIIFFYLWTSLAFSGQTPPNGFALSEHLASGEKIALSFDSDTPAVVNPTLHLPNGLKLSYGTLLSLGDLYGVLGQPISMGQSAKERQQRFLEAFQSFAENTAAIDEVKQLKRVIAEELKTIKSGMKQGESAEAIYQRIRNETGRQINCITGGGCLAANWWMFPGRYLKLAMENYDHFVPHAQKAYLSGHHVALKQALKARQTGLRKDLELAYALDAFACHFLSDQFAAGHLRTPRNQLSKYIKPELVGALLANYMHNEDNKQGLHVHNKNQDHWVVYGDFSYFNPLNDSNQQLLERALQASTDAVFNTYSSGLIIPTDAILAFLPETDSATSDNYPDSSPLFTWDEPTQKLLRRKDISNLYDKRMTANWWGWSTLLALKRQYGLTTEMRSVFYLLEHKIKAG